MPKAKGAGLTSLMVRFKITIKGSSLSGQRLGLRALIAGGKGSIPGQGTKIPQATRPKKRKK